MNNERIVNALRILSTDAINKAKSGFIYYFCNLYI